MTASLIDSMLVVLVFDKGLKRAFINKKIFVIDQGAMINIYKVSFGLYRKLTHVHGPIPLHCV